MLPVILMNLPPFMKFRKQSVKEILNGKECPPETM